MMGIFSSKSDDEKAAKRARAEAQVDFCTAKDRKARDAAEARFQEAQKRLNEAKRK